MSKKVLIVEDDDDLRSGLRLRLGSLGYEVVEASDGYFAIEIARKELPDVVLLDIGRSPAVTGSRFCSGTARCPSSAGFPSSS
jgi:DNA-binding response OmpR family regulator